MVEILKYEQHEQIHNDFVMLLSKSSFSMHVIYFCLSFGYILMSFIWNHNDIVVFYKSDN